MIDEETGGEELMEGEAAQEMTANIEYLMVGREEEDDQVCSHHLAGQTQYLIGASSYVHKSWSFDIVHVCTRLSVILCRTLRPSLGRLRRRLSSRSLRIRYDLADRLVSTTQPCAPCSRITPTFSLPASSQFSWWP